MMDIERIKKRTTKELLTMCRSEILKSKSLENIGPIYMEIVSRLGIDRTHGIRVACWGILGCESEVKLEYYCTMLDKECSMLLSSKTLKTKLLLILMYLIGIFIIVGQQMLLHIMSDFFENVFNKNRNNKSKVGPCHCYGVYNNKKSTNET